MVRPIDAMGLGPSREAVREPQGRWRVTVRPPAWSRCGDGASLTLTEAQYAQYRQWLDGGALIHEALADLSDGQRELLMTGIDETKFNELFRDIDNE
jgi:hypothetical protein